MQIDINLIATVVGFVITVFTMFWKISEFTNGFDKRLSFAEETIKHLSRENEKLATLVEADQKYKQQLEERIVQFENEFKILRLEMEKVNVGIGQLKILESISDDLKVLRRINNQKH